MTHSSEIASLEGHPTRVSFGAGAALRNVVALAPETRVLVVASTGARSRAPELMQALARRTRLVVADGVPAETTLDAVSSLVHGHRGAAVDCVLAIGGGTTMDAAKALAIGLPAPAPFEQVLRQPAEHAAAALPLICVPTTSGSGSEVTRWATIWDLAAGRKRSLSHEAVIPRDAWIDPTLMLTLPPPVTAASGLDALAHAMEAIWGRNHNAQSDALATRAAALIANCLPRALQAFEDLPARSGMAHAALAAGLAISITETAAAHAASYPLTLGHGLAHGHACALSLPWLLQWHAATCPERVAPLIAALGVADADAAGQWVRSIIARAGLATRLRDVGVRRDDIVSLVEAATASERMNNTVSALTPERVAEMFESAW